MAERRMFAKKITESDAFIDMPMSAQCLYFHLNMAADDDGFVNNPKKIMRSIGASNDDFSLLLMKSFVLSFDTGVIVIKHWKMHNYIQTDRYKPTDYIEEKSMLGLKKDKAYTLDVSKMDTKCIQDGYIGKDRLGKDRLEEDSKDNTDVSKSKRFTPPSIEEVANYINEKGYHFDADDFVNFYESKSWMVGKNKMSKWKAACAVWENRLLKEGKVKNGNTTRNTSADEEECESTKQMRKFLYG